METIPAVIAALPREVAALVRGFHPDPDLKLQGIFLYRLPGALIACAGMGPARVTLAVQAAVHAGAVSTLVSVGLAGACDPAIDVGSVVDAGCVIDISTGERLDTGHTGPVLVTTPAIAGVREKKRLRESYGAAIVDMEAAAVARLARMHGLRFRAIKAVSDAHDFDLDSLSRFATVQGQFRTGAFALHTALRPSTWRKTMYLGAASSRALRALTLALRTEILTAS